MKGAEPIFINKNSKMGVLLIHGFSGTPYQFKELSSYLASKGLTVYTPLLAGHGTDPEDMIKTTPEDWKKSVKDAYYKLKEKSKKIIVIGNSFGGNLALWLAKELNNEPVGLVSLGTPIFMRFQWIIKLRLYLYGWTRKYYRKHQRIYKTDYTDMMDEVTYPVIPVKNIWEFFDFLENETFPNLDKVKVPTFIIHANVDPVVNPKSAVYIHQYLNSNHKMIYWFDSKEHVITNRKNDELFERIYDFIKQVDTS